MGGAVLKVDGYFRVAKTINNVFFFCVEEKTFFTSYDPESTYGTYYLKLILSLF